MKLILIIGLFFQQSVLSSIRFHFEHINQSEEHVVKLKTLLKADSKLSAAILQGYLASCLMAEASYRSNPFDKIKHFNKGKELLEAAIKSYPEQIELHYIRYTIQKNVPSILNYNDALDKDKAFLIEHTASLKKEDVELYQKIKVFLESHAKLSEHEQLKLNQ